MLSNQANRSCNEVVITKLDRLIRSINPFAQLYKTLKEVESEETERTASIHAPVPKVNLTFYRDRHSDKIRYNLPTADEIAALFR